MKTMETAKIAPLAVYLASDAQDVTGQIFAVRANEIFLMSQSRPLRSVHRAEGWTPETDRRAGHPGAAAAASTRSTARRTCSPGTRCEARAAERRHRAGRRRSFWLVRSRSCVHRTAPPRRSRRLARDVDGIIIRSKLPDDIFEAAPRVRAVVVHGTGTDLVPLESATAHGVMVANLPGINAQSVAEYCAMAMLMLARNIVAITNALRTDTWDEARLLGAERARARRHDRSASSASARSAGAWRRSRATASA